jgi:hypothetical protein
MKSVHFMVYLGQNPMPFIRSHLSRLHLRLFASALSAVLFVFISSSLWAENASAFPFPRPHLPQATSDPHFAYVEIRLWPEFDQPSMLVMYTLVLTQTSPIPAELAIRIPTSAGMPTSVSIGPDPDTLFDVDFTHQVEGQWSTLRLKTALPLIRIEYYDPTIVKSGKNRHFIFSWPADYHADTILMQIQKPYGAKNIQISPAISNSEWATDGVLNYYSADVTSMADGNPFSIDLSYQKDQDQLSVTSLEVRSTIPITYQTTGRVRWWSTFPWLLFVPLIVILLVISGLLYLRINPLKLIPLPIEKARIAKTDKTNPSTQDMPVWVQHCPQCGRRANPGDRFCRTCGTHLRNVL